MFCLMLSNIFNLNIRLIIPVLNKLRFWFKCEVLSESGGLGDGWTQGLVRSFTLHEKKDILFFVFINYVKELLHF